MYLEDDNEFNDEADFRSPNSRWNLMMAELPSNFDHLMFGRCTGQYRIRTEFKHIALSQESRCAEGYLVSRKGCFNSFRTLPFIFTADHQINQIGYWAKGEFHKQHNNQSFYDDPHIYYMEPYFSKQRSEFPSTRPDEKL